MFYSAASGLWHLQSSHISVIKKYLSWWKKSKTYQWKYQDTGIRRANFKSSKQLWSQWSEIPNFKPCFKPDHAKKGGTILNAPRKIGDASLLKLVFTDCLVCFRIPRILSLPCACSSLCSPVSLTDIPAKEQNHTESTSQGLVIVFLRLDSLLKVINSALLKKKKKKKKVLLCLYPPTLCHPSNPKLRL